MTNKTLKQQETFAAVAFERLKAEGFDAAAAQAIASRFDANRIARQIEWIDSRQVRSNRLGMLRTAIEQNWSAPQRRKLGAPNPEPRQGTTFEQAIATSRRRFRNQTTS